MAAFKHLIASIGSIRRRGRNNQTTCIDIQNYQYRYILLRDVKLITMTCIYTGCTSSSIHCILCTGKNANITRTFKFNSYYDIVSKPKNSTLPRQPDISKLNINNYPRGQKTLKINFKSGLMVVRILVDTFIQSLEPEVVWLASDG